MVFSQAVLVLFAALWLVGQFNDQREQLKRNLVKLFTDVQLKVADSIDLTQVIDPLSAGKSGLATNYTFPSASTSRIALSPQGLHRVLSGASNISKYEERHLFNIDTIVFNELFNSQMRQNGWNFNSEWINSPDSNKKGGPTIMASLLRISAVTCTAGCSPSLRLSLSCSRSPPPPSGLPTKTSSPRYASQT